jgi:hypothetical protein
MKFWRIFAAAAVVGMLLPPTVAMADDDDDDDDMKSPVCVKDTAKTDLEGLTQCPDYLNNTNTFVGNGFPWENSAFFFSTFRNQYLYSSASLAETAKITCNIQSIAARSVTFVGGSTNVYGSFDNGTPSSIGVYNGFDTLVPQFGVNTMGNALCELTGTNANPIVIGATAAVPNGSTISVCESCPGTGQWANEWCFIDLASGVPSGGLVVDMTLSVGSGTAGAGVWDTSDQTFGTGCDPGGSRAFGSSTFANTDNLTTALGIDGFDFVWVFKGTAAPPPATVEQQIKEIIRLLLTPQGLRCSGLDLHKGNSRIEDDPIAFPNGINLDPISPQIGAGELQGGDEKIDDLRFRVGSVK